MDDTLAEFLRYEDLLGKAILFFFRELMRKDDRLYKTQAELQRENLCLDVKNLQASVTAAQANLNQALDDNSEKSDKLYQEIKYLRKAQASWESRSDFMLDFPEWRDFLNDKLDEIGEGVKGNSGKLDKLIEMLTTIMQQQNLSSQLKPSDEFTQHNSQNLNLIKQLVSEFKQISKKDKKYSQVSMMLGSALSSTGDLKKAARLFQDVLDKSSVDSERALAHFNLFQVNLRQKDYPVAVEHLQLAIELDYSSFALHNARKYPPVKLLGAGGMGVVFLCENKNFLLEKVEKVVVKCFWETLKGSSEEVFKEPLAMSKIAGDYVPKSFDYGYMNDFTQERVFFVTEYIDEAMDGEAWLEKYGPLNVETGLSVALDIAKGLQLAHKNGIFHLDLKPANLLLKRINSGVEVKIIDFGLSQVASSLADTAIQKSQSKLSFFGNAVLCGTLDYSPPEQQSYERYLKPNAKNDVFAFGATLYRLFTGKRPRPFSERKLPKVDSLRELLCDCVEDNPKERPDSAVTLVKRLESILTPQVPSPLKAEESIKKESKMPDFVKKKYYKWKSLYLPHNTSIRMKYKGDFYYAKIEGENLLYNGKIFSPSKFANFIANGSMNAWRYLYVKRPDDDKWHLTDDLRKKINVDSATTKSKNISAAVIKKEDKMQEVLKNTVV